MINIYRNVWHCKTIYKLLVQDFRGRAPLTAPLLIDEGLVANGTTLSGAGKVSQND